jgi:hypothetical protein
MYEKVKDIKLMNKFQPTYTFYHHSTTFRQRALYFYFFLRSRNTLSTFFTL